MASTTDWTEGTGWPSRLQHLANLPADNDFAGLEAATKARVQALLLGFEAAGVTTEAVRLFASASGAVDVVVRLGAISLSARFGPRGNPSVTWVDLDRDYAGELTS